MRKLSSKPSTFNGRTSKLSWYLRVTGDRTAVLESVPHNIPMPPAIKHGVETKPGFVDWFPVEGDMPSDQEIDSIKQMFDDAKPTFRPTPKFQVEIYD